VADSGNNCHPLIQTAPAAAATIAAITNGARHQTGAVAGGEIVVVYGTGIGIRRSLWSRQPDPSRRSNLNGVTLLVNGTPRVADYVSAAQLSAIIPGFTGANAQVVVHYQGQSSARLTVPLPTASPALFTANLEPVPGRRWRSTRMAPPTRIASGAQGQRADAVRKRRTFAIRGGSSLGDH